MKALSVFYSRAMEGLSFEDIKTDSLYVERILRKVGIEMTNPFKGKKKVFSEIKNRTPKQVVMRDLSELAKCDVFLLNCTVPNWNYVGSLCELMYAYFLRKYIVVYTAKTGYDNRYWLVYHSNFICRSLNTAVNHILKIR